MKKSSIIGVTALLAVFLMVSLAAAQPMRMWKGSGGWGMGSQYQRMYNPATAETIRGEIVGIDRIMPMRGMSYGIHLQVKTEKGTIPVHLGPAWYIERMDAKLEKGDTIEVKGSRVQMKGQEAIIAAEVKKGDQTLRLRDENGFPFWSGWRR
ncbi:MAG: DNA-binding protein [Nitrospirales bacterium]|nr:DNA-binding protein [Nitrospirales bacterium]